MSGRFPATGDPQVDQALSGLPDPDALPSPDDLAQAPGDGDHGTGQHGEDGENGVGEDGPEGAGARGPDLTAQLAEHLDGQIADVTAVHRRLQQRLSDLSG
ncbi:hypothetical protein HJ588_18765 [Flexivirga sp. ID2601S]|uniref:Uncharacterized protein n=1 Tax=Flexivirga aerilata TaxID=1656889 RepID=A0A849AP75_9MICO|nr:hypothetical protein [Flexivirga aerilata]NNG41306.1 hypothetical protein [Flexivirga aerilata]